MTKTKRPAGYYSKAAREARALARQRRAAARLNWSDEKRVKMAAKSAKFFAKHAARAALAGNEKETRRLSVHMTRFDNVRRALGAVLAVRAARFRIEAAA
ncbi:hypothetical protein CcrColossus_gp029 [Caulobacter phage CcrColossus]|uniref:30S ribosomal protein S20 n=1 Tax=Caulobacter phage CcrColossus TaxID=1211640 RepID=K4JRH4_9CAUD|nr:hypothetical protein CcrColossus_gp029 [Caulobacter phage CcrColossus]AFU87899.1 hypothetical protein CcrColossus_gp029 [Caulobacter phage CcrColossus]